jgi:(p)ppGpp synthase/HD superfamily hydrolase
MNMKKDFKAEEDTFEKTMGAMALVHNAKVYGKRCHGETNHTYDNKPYDVHLEMVHHYATRYSYLLEDVKSVEIACAAAWVHDVIEDCRETYNDVKFHLGKEVADIVYALTNEKGRNRKERANDSYYEGIRSTPLATFVKLCDRLANASYSQTNGGHMLDVYRNEHLVFEKQLKCDKYNPMWDELSKLLYADGIV